MKEKVLTDSQMAAVIDLLWDSLRRDREHKDRRMTGWGSKTKVGLLACLHRIYNEEEISIGVNEGDSNWR
jgi:hypothetical protein